MKSYDTEQIRNVVLIGHGGSGKTSLAEAMMYQIGAIGRIGRVDTGTTLSDTDPDEIQRKISISVSLIPVQYNDVKINILDTPGYADFIADVIGAISVSDISILIVDAVNGVEVQTERYWRMVDAKAIPRAIFINKMDKEHADFDTALNSLKSRLGNGVVAVQLPIGAEANFRGYIDIIRMKAYLETDDTTNPKEIDIPTDLEGRAAELRVSIMEAAAEANDDLMMKYLDEGELSDDEIESGLQSAISSGRAFPVFVGSAYKNYGTSALLDSLVVDFPAPNKVTLPHALRGESDFELKSDTTGPLAAYVFKTAADPFAGRISFLRIYSGSLHSASEVTNSKKGVKERIGNLFVMVGKQQDSVDAVKAGDIIQVAKLHDTTTCDTLSTANDKIVVSPTVYPEPMLSFSIAPATKGEDDKLAQGMHRFIDEDPTLRFEQDPETHEAIIAGMGEVQIDVVRDRLKRKFNVNTNLGNPTVAYRETVRIAAEGHGRHKKQTGGAGQFGDCKIRVEPLERGSGFEFVDAVVGGVIPRQFIPSVEKGVRESMKRGPLAGYPVVDIRCTVFDGSYHPVDSKDIAFQMAGRLAFQEATSKAQVVLIEPYVNIEVTVPDGYIGDIIGGISSKRGRVQGSEALGGGMSVVRAVAPQAEMFQYSNELTALTQGRGSFSMTISHYEEVPSHIADQVKTEAKSRSEEER